MGGQTEERLVLLVRAAWRSHRSPLRSLQSRLVHACKAQEWEAESVVTFNLQEKVDGSKVLVTATDGSVRKESFAGSILARGLLKTHRVRVSQAQADHRHSQTSIRGQRSTAPPHHHTPPRCAFAGHRRFLQTTTAVRPLSHRAEGLLTGAALCCVCSGFGGN